MNDNAKKWVEALRSGEFKQGKHVLRAITEAGVFDCCLGVACVIAQRNGVELIVERKPMNEAIHGAERSIAEIDTFNGMTQVLPDVVKDWLGLHDISGKFSGNYATEHGIPAMDLTGLNDGGMTFPEIAAFIEKEPIGLFAGGDAEQLA